MIEFLQQLKDFTISCQRPEWGTENVSNAYCEEMSEQIKGAIVAILEKRMGKGFAPPEGIRDMYMRLKETK